MARLSPNYRRQWKAAHPVYGQWLGMRRYCGFVKGATERQQRYYVGVAICDEWLDYRSFEEWALRNGWREGAILARKDKSLGYGPDNCTWTTKAISNGWRRNIRRFPNGKSARDILGYDRLGIDEREQNAISHRIFRVNLKSSRVCAEAGVAVCTAAAPANY